MTFYAYLQTVLHGLNQVKLTKSAQDIGRRVAELRRHLETYSNFFVKVGTSLESASAVYEKAENEFRKIDKDIIRIAAVDEVLLSEAKPPEEAPEKESSRALF
jgi:DNA recombination protein RmuC